MKESEVQKLVKEALEQAIEGKQKNNGVGVGEALLKLVNLLYDTDDTKLAELSWLDHREVFPMSIQMTKEEALKEERTIPLTKVWRTAYLRLKRSVQMKAFMVGAGLAHEQAAAEAEKAEEEIEL